jgi:hypothetical protein
MSEPVKVPNYRKPEQNVTMTKFNELMERVAYLEKALEEKRGRKPKEE